MIKLKIYNSEVIIENFKWKCDNDKLESLLNSLTELSKLNSLSIAEPDLEEAKRITQIFGKNAEIIEIIKNPAYERKDNRIY